MKNKFFFLKLTLLLALSVSLVFVAAANEPLDELEDIFDHFEHHSGKVYTMVDQDGEVIMRTARQVVVGDEYINIANNYYRVVSVEESTATAELIERVTLAEPQKEGFLARVDRLMRNAIPVQQGEQQNRRIAVYNSHGAEAYIEGDGAESKDEGGGILDVGDAFAKALEDQGVDVIRSRETHTPHDAGAYQRSRRTAEEALKQSPDALIDVHRDAVPEEEYLEEVEGEQRVQIQLVVGRQNQNMAATQEFAEGLKNAADEKYPGLVKGIFMARGSYNQDLSPTAVLIEVGSHTNDKDSALESVELFAEVVNDYLYGENGEAAGGPLGTDAPGTPGGTALRSILWVILGLVVVVGAFLVISAGGFDQAKAKLKNFKNREFTNTLGLPRDEDEKQESEEDRDDGGSEGG
jgi:stage II sporulation protein P